MLITAPTMPGRFGLAARPARPPWGRRWSGVVATLAVWCARRRTRQHLGALTGRELADVGLTRDQQRSECAKAFWQP